MAKQKTECECWDDGYAGIKYCSLHAAAAAMLEELQRLEWQASCYGRFPDLCKVCQGIEREGHKDDCTLASAIKAATGH